MKKANFGRVKKTTIFVFLAPALLLYTGFKVLPILGSFILSFMQWKGFGKISFVGITNYINMFRDEMVLEAFKNNLIFGFFSIFLGVGLGLLLALLLDRNIKAKNLFRVSIYLPQILSMVVIGFLWTWLYNPYFGLINSFFSAIGADFLIRNWLGDSNLVVYSISVVGIWRNYGFSMVVFYAALQNIPQEIIDSASIDGATEFQKIRKIILPLLKPIAAVIVALTLINVFRIFDIFYIMAGDTGRRVDVLATVIFKNAFSYNKMGYASAISVVVCFLTMLISIVYFKTLGQASTDNS